MLRPFTEFSPRTPHSPLHNSDAVHSQEGGLTGDDSDEEVGMEGDVADMGLDMPGAIKVLLNAGGRKVSAQAKQVSKDAYLGFLLLRHLKIRDLRHKVREHWCGKRSTAQHPGLYEYIGKGASHINQWG